MIVKLVLLFTIVPLVELALLLYLSTLISFWPTLGIVIATALAGAYLGKLEGMRAWHDIQRDLQEMRMPTESLLDGLAVLIAGIFLITPGVLTDLAAIVLLIPPLRTPLRNLAKRRLQSSMNTGSFTFISDQSHPSPFGPGRSPFERQDLTADIIDVTPDQNDSR